MSFLLAFIFIPYFLTVKEVSTFEELNFARVKQLVATRANATSEFLEKRCKTYKRVEKRTTKC